MPAPELWGHYVLGSVVEVGLLAAIVYSAWNWPRLENEVPSAPAAPQLVS